MLYRIPRTKEGEFPQFGVTHPCRIEQWIIIMVRWMSETAHCAIACPYKSHGQGLVAVVVQVALSQESSISLSSRQT